jgi:hypothetical protein
VAYPTLEARWILPGPLPDQLVEWFGGGPPERRVDRYLVAGADLGVKVRGGAALELKVRERGLGPRRWGDRAAGRLEAWSKWTFPLQASWDERSLGEAWVEVEKTRRMRRFAVEPAGSGSASLVEISQNREVESGCDAELTDLRAFDGSWWTIGFEAFGPLDDRERTLVTAAGHVLAGLPDGVILRLEDALAYPGWIARRTPIGSD